jgi:hypothetical protein
MNTPVLFIVFNRPDTTTRVFEAISLARPPRLYFAVDGPRVDNPEDVENITLVRNLVLNNIDWDCQVFTLFRDQNLGCKRAVSDAINWFFEREEMGIILEDDCLPNMSFFAFCEELLNKYKDDERIMMASGFNKLGKWNSDKYDYFFSNLGGIWGWASWRRAWKQYDGDMKNLEYFTQRKYFEYLFGRKAGKIRAKEIADARNANVNSWAYPWGFTRHINSGLAIVPSVNLVENIGFGDDSTHTKGKKGFSSNTYEMTFPLINNNIVVADRKYDELFLAKKRIKKRIADLLR